VRDGDREEVRAPVTTTIRRQLQVVVFDSAASMRRSFGIELEQYLQDRGFRSTPPAQPATR
jgi:hypothetical protein